MSKASVSQIAEAIILKSKEMTYQELVDKVASFVISERRTAEVGKIMREVERLRRLEGVSEVTITTATPASEEVKMRVKQLFGNHNIIINEEIDKTIIGGVCIESEEYFLDLTIRGRLEQLKTGVK